MDEKYERYNKYPPPILSYSEATGALRPEISGEVRTELDKFSDELKSLRFLLHLLRWLNAIADPSNDLLNPISTELLTKIQYNPGVKYKFNVGRSLPNFDNFENAIAWLDSNTQGLVENGHIILPTVKFVTYLKSMLLRSQPEWVNRVPYIPNYYLYRTDFKTKVLLTYEEVLHTLNRDSEYDISRVINKISKPILYADPNSNQVFLFYRANLEPQERIEVTQDLFREIRGVEIPESDFVEYIISTDGQLVAVENLTGKLSGSAGPFLTLIPDGILIPLL
jgi:hypothetical protein